MTGPPPVSRRTAQTAPVLPRTLFRAALPSDNVHVAHLLPRLKTCSRSVSLTRDTGELTMAVMAPTPLRRSPPLHRTSSLVLRVDCTVYVRSPSFRLTETYASHPWALPRTFLMHPLKLSPVNLGVRVTATVTLTLELPRRPVPRSNPLAARPLLEQVKCTRVPPARDVPKCIKLLLVDAVVWTTKCCAAPV